MFQLIVSYIIKQTSLIINSLDKFKNKQTNINQNDFLKSTTLIPSNIKPNLLNLNQKIQALISI